MRQDSYYEISSSESEGNFEHLAPDGPPSPKSKYKTNRKSSQDHEHVPLIKAPPKQLNIAKEHKPRLIIDRIVLQNFKSYAGKHIIGPFHDNFTSVVGPNGSGKSNLIQCMLFIFGYNASWMRLNKLNQLIHNSSTMSGITKATVEVQFKKIIQLQSGHYNEIRDSGFSVRRTINQQNVSKYFFNGHDSTQTEIKEKLKAEGIDLNNNRFLILQGEVEQISQMKQKSGDRDKPGLLEYLEDITGSNAFIDRIEESINQYSRTEEIKHEKGQLMKIVEKELKSMNKGKEEAIKYVKKERNIYQAQNILNQVIISNSKFENDELTKKLEKLEMEKERIVAEEREKLKKQGERIKEIKRLKLENENLHKKMQQIDQQLNKMNIEDQNLKQEAIFKSEDCIKYKKKIETLEQEFIAIVKESDEIVQNLPKNKQIKDKLEQETQAIKEELSKHDNAKFSSALKKLQNELKQHEHEINSFQDKLKIAKKNFEKRFVPDQNSQIKIVELENKIDEDNDLLSKIVQSIQLAGKKQNSLQGDIDHIDKERKQVRNELQKMENILRQEINENKERGLVNNMFQKIMEEKIPGVLGRLGDLGMIKQKKYDEIITSCCRGRLDNIVVTNYQAAKAVTNFLKMTKMGRITCIILDSIKKQISSSIDRAWEDLPDSRRLFDLIEPASNDARYAFYFALSDTIYCQNSNLGLKYAMGDERNRRRVVSRKQTGGFIIYEKNGMMIGCVAKRGGFEVKAKIKMRNQANSKEVKEMQGKKKELSSALSVMNAKIDNLAKEVREVQSDIQEMTREKNKIASGISMSKEEIEDIKKSSFQNTKNFEVEKETREKEMECLEDRIQKTKELYTETEEKIARIQNERKNSETKEVNLKREAYKEKRNQYSKIEKEIQKHEAIVSNTKERIAENQNAKAKYQKIFDKLEKDLNKLKKEREKIEEQGLKIAQDHSSLSNKIKQHQEKETEVRKLFQEDEKEVKESKKKIDQAKAEVQRCKDKIRHFEEEIAIARGQLQRVRQTYKQLISTYDFLEDLEEIEGMRVEGAKYIEQGSSFLEASMLMNKSMSMSSDKSARMFPIEQLLATSPFQDLDEEAIDPFLLFHDKLISFLMSEKEALNRLSGSNILIINEYKKKYTYYKTKYDEFQFVVQRQEELRTLIDDLKSQRLNTFKEGFSTINSKLKEVYQLLTKGGDAELQLIDSLDPFTEGINFSVRPPKKTWKEINKLSGGEKTLSSLSLIFALHYYKPTPLYFMDEIDAALDFKNVSIVAQYIKKRTKDAQFIIISLRNNMFDLADKLIGVYKTYDKTKTVHFLPEIFMQAIRNEKQNTDKNISN